jgi:two-component system, cell cycle sensor histidine kinase and response regulator CckA
MNNPMPQRLHPITAGLVDGQSEIRLREQAALLDKAQDSTIAHTVDGRSTWRSQRIESLGTFAGGIAHDLNNILSPILMASQILQLRETDERKLAALRVIEQGAEHGAEMARLVLTFVRGSDGEKALLQFKHVLREAAQIAKEIFPNSVVVETKIASDLLPIKGNANQLQQVLLNLFLNARDAMPNGGTISVYARNALREAAQDASGAAVSIRVCDKGMGMPPEVLDRIFDPFFTTKPPEKAMGLGLSTAFGIIKNHGGSINVSSEPGKGSEFTILLPAADQTPLKTTTPQSFENLRGGGQLILVVCREPLTRGSMEYVLERHNYQVLQAREIQSALELIKQRGLELDMVIIDSASDAPALSAFISQIRRVNPRICVIHSGDSSAKETNTALLNKPYSALDLLKTVQRGLRERQD